MLPHSTKGPQNLHVYGASGNGDDNDSDYDDNVSKFSKKIIGGVGRM